MRSSQKFFVVTLACMLAPHAFATELEDAQAPTTQAEVQSTQTSRVSLRPRLLPGADGQGYFLTRDAETVVQQLSAAEFYQLVGRKDLQQFDLWRTTLTTSLSSFGVSAVVLGSALALPGLIGLNPSQDFAEQSIVSVGLAVTGVGTMLGGLTSLAIAWLVGDDKLDSAEAKSLAAAYNNRPE